MIGIFIFLFVVFTLYLLYLEMSDRDLRKARKKYEVGMKQAHLVAKRAAEEARLDVEKL